LGFGSARFQAINKLAIIEDESGRIDPNKANTFPRKNITNYDFLEFEKIYLSYGYLYCT
jgi:hypothetical protein